jgi:putative thioredoxin
LSQTALVKDVTEATFAADVVEASRTRPVVVDFWATWCQPCHQLSPLLEAAAGRYAGDVDLVKVDVDQNQNLARAFRVQGIPAVKAFRDGRIVGEFTGAQPAAVVERLFAALAPSPADRLAAAAAAAGTDQERERGFRAALEQQADHPAAAVGLARILADRDEVADARALLGRVPADDEAVRLLAELELRGQARDSGELAALRDRAAAGDARARLELGQALAAAGQYDEALALLVEATGDRELRDEARERTVEVFRLLGDTDPRVRTWRPRLAAALF